jgi:hypothetical protein
MFTTVLSSIAIASAKHIVKSTITFSRASSPEKPSSGTEPSGVLRAFLAEPNPPGARSVP